MIVSIGKQLTHGRSDRLYNNSIKPMNPPVALLEDAILLSRLENPHCSHVLVSTNPWLSPVDRHFTVVGGTSDWLINGMLQGESFRRNNGTDRDPFWYLFFLSCKPRQAPRFAIGLAVSIPFRNGERSTAVTAPTDPPLGTADVPVSVSLRSAHQAASHAVCHRYRFWDALLPINKQA